MCRWYDAVVDGNTLSVYVKNQGTKKIYSFDVTSDSWSQLTDCVYVNGSVTVNNGWLTTVGGYPCPYYSNELFSLTGEGSGIGSGLSNSHPCQPLGYIQLHCALEPY